MLWVRVPPEQLFSFSMEREMFRLIVLSCFDLYRSNSFHARKKTEEEEKEEKVERRESE